ncbi:MAG TPA: hypothetical protein VJN18_28045 [Polyangiaceae bacterium]|nr:hypothetical protein [Polyangiaceae bacterium]
MINPATSTLTTSRAPTGASANGSGRAGSIRLDTGRRAATTASAQATSSSDQLTTRSPENLIAAGVVIDSSGAGR